MLSAYTSTPRMLAHSALSIVLRHTTRAASSHNPLRVTVEVDDLGLPLTPLASTVPTPPPVRLSSVTLEKLHRLSALNPPARGSEEEERLITELGGLIGLMEVVKGVQLPEGRREDVIRDLLGMGVGEVVIGDPDDTAPAAHEAGKGKEGGEVGTGEGTSIAGREKNGRELLDWATNRVGDYYASRINKG